MDDKRTPAFGKRLLQHFEFHPEYRNLNHGKTDLSRAFLVNSVDAIHN